MARSTRTNRGWQCHACVQENPVGEKPVFRRETVQTEYTEVECILQSLGRAGYEGEKRVKKRSRGRGGGEKRACIFHAKSSSRSARVQHVLSSPIAPVGVVPWKPLVCAFLQPSSTVSYAEKGGREGERGGQYRQESVHHRERRRENFTRLFEREPSFFPERVGGVLCHTARYIYVLCMYVYIDTGFGKIVSRAWKNLDPSLRWVVIHVKQADFQAESGVVGGWTISILVCSGSNVVMSETQVSWCLIGGSSIC